MQCQIQESLKPDETGISNYIVKLSERDTQALISLRNRNGAGTITGGVKECAAIWKIIDQVCSFIEANEGLDNYD